MQDRTAASSSSAPPPVTISDSDRHTMLHVLLLVVTNSSPKVSRKLAAAENILPIMISAAEVSVDEYRQTAISTAVANTSHSGELEGVPAWIQIVLALGVAVSKLQPDVKPPPPPPRDAPASADGGRGPWPHARGVTGGLPSSVRRHHSRVASANHAADEAAALAAEARGVLAAADEEGAEATGVAEAALAALQAASDRLREAEEAAAEHLERGGDEGEPGAGGASDAPAGAAADDASAPMDTDAADGGGSGAGSAAATATPRRSVPLATLLERSIGGRGGTGATATTAAEDTPLATAAATGASSLPEDVAQARLGPHWQFCGMLGSDNEHKLIKLCVDLIDVLHMHAERMPQPNLLSLSESEVHACVHPRSILFNVLQLLMQLGKRWDNAQHLSASGCVEKLLSMPVPALCSGSLEDMTMVLQQIMEDPVHVYPVRFPLFPVLSCRVVLLSATGCTTAVLGVVGQ